MGATFAACMWIYTKAVVCSGQRNMHTFGVNKMNLIMEAVNWVCDDLFDDHEQLSEISLALRETTVLEALNYDIEGPKETVN